MRTRGFINGIGSFFGTMGSAIAVSAAIDGRRPPRSADLARLGIDPDQFRRISRY